MSTPPSDDVDATPRAWFRTRVPESALGLTSVVRAFEDADVAGLNSALDQVDSTLINRLPQVVHCAFLGLHNEEQDYAFFNALAHSEDRGEIPLSLLASATFVLAGGSQPWSNWLWVQEHSAEEWLAVYTALVMHPNVDVNTVREIEDVLADQRTLHQTILKFGGNATHEPILNADCFSPFDYGFRALISELRGLHLASTANVNQEHLKMRMLAALAGSGKLNLARKIHKMPFAPPQPEDDVLSSALYNGLFAVVYALLSLPGDEIAQLAIRALAQGRTTFYHQKNELQTHSVGQAVLRAVAARIALYHREKILIYVRRVARMHIDLARWWTAARESAYRPGCSGAKRARLSFEKNL